MKSFTYTIKDKTGIHARPAGLLCKLAKEFECESYIEKDEKSVSLKKLIMIMGLGVKCGDTVTIRVSGEDEDKALEVLENFFRENL